LVDPSQPSDSAARPGPKRPTGFPLLILCVGIFLLASWRVSSQRIWNWDLIGYIGCANETRGMSAEENHRATFAEIERVAPPEAFAELKGGEVRPGDQRGYRQAIYESPVAFEAQLSFYRGRWVYIRLFDLLRRSSAGAVESAYGLSWAAAAGIVLLLMTWLARSMPLFPAAVLAWAGMELADGFESAAYASPDSLATLLALAGAFALTEARNKWVAAALLCCALGTRIDHVTFVLPLLFWATFRGFGKARELSIPALGVLLGLIAALLYGCTVALDTYGWWTVHWHTFHQFMPFPEEQTPPRDLVEGFLFTVRSFPKLASQQGLFFCLVPLAGLWLARRRGISGSSFGLCVVALVGLFAHFALLPELWPRLMGPYWLIGWVGLLGQLWPRKPAIPVAAAS
jgi:hypothetical protein